MVQIGEVLPHFELDDTAGRRVRYADSWQRRFLVLVAIGDVAAPDARAYVDALASASEQLTAHDTSLVVYEPARQTSATALDRLPPAPSVTIVDRWGEIQEIAAPASVHRLPPVDEIVGWLRYVQMQCPECQGETR